MTRRWQIKITLALAVGLLSIMGWVHFGGSDNEAKEDPVSAQEKTTIKQNYIKTRLSKYLKSYTKDGTVSVSFYNLGAKPGSKAAKASNADLYERGKLAVESRSHTKHVSASTYKLFIAAYLMNLKKKGQFSWTKANKANVSNMIVHSRNEYAESVLNRYGQTSLNRFIKRNNWYSPVFKPYKAAGTTSHSLMLVLRDLHDYKGAFSNRSDAKRILGYMGRQVYRSGIPAGARKAQKGTKVNDKVGWLGSTNNDAGIVTLPNGQQYLLVVMTHGHKQSGFSGFPKMTKRVQEIVYENK
ncbi:beta-lactamase class A [Secundilactobacillus oryzae JCM 18671]|uniref:Beta-lactamase class A n=1 Tax=Secundilactobacillus oryzae JCM 18671 TaxID=1291743 RepID=A0A081BHS1_9LACO|nr:serine hydrolase [Secundilactobacillus oryzae]GAK47589.1 beta-lactamase class A [Secundilactobacillus oryzae JCM 18671]